MQLCYKIVGELIKSTGRFLLIVLMTPAIITINIPVSLKRSFAFLTKDLNYNKLSFFRKAVLLVVVGIPISLFSLVQLGLKCVKDSVVFGITCLLETLFILPKTRILAKYIKNAVPFLNAFLPVIDMAILRMGLIAGLGLALFFGLMIAFPPFGAMSAVIGAGGTLAQALGLANLSTAIFPAVVSVFVLAVTINLAVLATVLSRLFILKAETGAYFGTDVSTPVYIMKSVASHRGQVRMVKEPRLALLQNNLPGGGSSQSSIGQRFENSRNARISDINNRLHYSSMTPSAPPMQKS